MGRPDELSGGAGDVEAPIAGAPGAVEAAGAAGVAGAGAGAGAGAAGVAGAGAAGVAGAAAGGRTGAAGADAVGAAGRGVDAAGACAAGAAGVTGRGVRRAAGGTVTSLAGRLFTRREPLLDVVVAEVATGAVASAGDAGTSAGPAVAAGDVRCALGLSSAGSSGWTARRRPSLSALRRTRSAWASSIDEE
jgi:hypothetical protein